MHMQSRNLSLIPSSELEDDLADNGYNFIAGIDEVGRGALAGPVVAAAVILPRDYNLYIDGGVRDSKLLNTDRRGLLFGVIKSTAVSIGIGIISTETIDEINILNATRRAMKEALDQLAYKPDYLLIDGMFLSRVPISQKGIVKGDIKCISIACASIIAKVTRDRIMIDLHEKYPQYGFNKHKGYGTKEHLTYLSRIGPCPIHRYSFAPVRNTFKIL